MIGLALPLAFVLADISRGGATIDWPALAIWAPITGAALGIAYLIYYTGLARGAVTVVSSAASAWLAITILIAVALFGERVVAGQLVLMAAILVGILLLSAGRLSGSDVGSGLPWGLGAMLCIGIGMGFFDRVTEASDPMLGVLIVRALSALPVFAFSRGRGVPVRLPNDRVGWALLVAVGIVDAAGYVGYNIGIDAAPVSVIAPISAAHPLVTIVLAVVINRERPRAFHWAGATLTIAATMALSIMVA